MTRYFVREGQDPYALFSWRQDADTGVEAPAGWSSRAVHVVSTRYFAPGQGEQSAEQSVRQLVHRVVDGLWRWAVEDGYFASAADAKAFADELAFILLSQRAAFNSPVWFNLGLEDQPQCAACFINGVEDSLDSILELCRTEGRLFQRGSGAGVNLSALRACSESVRGGGTAAGPVSFMRGFDAFAGVIKSGGRTRRAAKMVVLDADHPDIEAFVRSKAHEEARARQLIDLAQDDAAADDAYHNVWYQNANHAVRVSDAFMRAVESDAPWPTVRRTDGRSGPMLQARALWHEIATAAHACGDPGLQFSTTIDRWHTCKATGPIRASNPCSEFMFLDDTACNLASINLVPFLAADGTLDVPALHQVVRVMLTAQEIMVDRAGYPTPRIAERVRDFRPLGLGITNLGGALMTLGLAYDSDVARSWAGHVMALVTGTALAQSHELAAARGAFAGYNDNRDAMWGVLQAHATALSGFPDKDIDTALVAAVRRIWAAVMGSAKDIGFRHAQVTAVAPTGTIAFMMDCATTGVEPELALVKTKHWHKGGTDRLVNPLIDRALRVLGYDDGARKRLVLHVETHGGLADAPDLEPQHAAVFDTAWPYAGRRLSVFSHVAMVSAIQPFVSGAVSKTVNLPASATPEDVETVFSLAWRLGLKAIAVYRDGSKGTQPLSAPSAEG